LNTIFQISGLIAWNPEYPILPGEKPACLNLFGCPIVVSRDIQSVEGKKVLGMPMFRIWPVKM